MTDTTTRHYLDYNATTPVRAEVVDAVCAAMRTIGNSSSVHAEGRGARTIVEEGREKLRTLINGPVNGVIITGGGTEAIHYALHGTVRNGSVKRIFVSVFLMIFSRLRACPPSGLKSIPTRVVPVFKASILA